MVGPHFRTPPYASETRCRTCARVPRPAGGAWRQAGAAAPTAAGCADWPHPEPNRRAARSESAAHPDGSSRQWRDHRGRDGRRYRSAALEGSRQSWWRRDDDGHGRTRRQCERRTGGPGRTGRARGERAGRGERAERDDGQRRTGQRGVAAARAHHRRARQFLVRQGARRRIHRVRVARSVPRDVVRSEEIQPAWLDHRAR